MWVEASNTSKTDTKNMVCKFKGHQIVMVVSAVVLMMMGLCRESDSIFVLKLNRAACHFANKRTKDYFCCSVYRYIIPLRGAVYRYRAKAENRPNNEGILE